MLIAAIPWLRRGWRMVPARLRLPVFGAAAAAGLFLAFTGRDELKQAIQDLRANATD